MKKEESRFAASTVFEGMTSIRAVLATDKSFNDRRIERVLYDRDRADGHAKELTWLRYRAAELGFTVEETDAVTLDGMTTSPLVPLHESIGFTVNKQSLIITTPDPRPTQDENADKPIEDTVFGMLT